jgi:hypothetical protein
MKSHFSAIVFAGLSFVSVHSFAQPKSDEPTRQSVPTKHLFIDVHQFEPGKLKVKDVENAHVKDLAVQEKYGVQIFKYWVDESKGKVYCLASADNAEALRKTHAEAHGLIPQQIYPVSAGMEAAAKGNRPLFLDVHYLGAGKVTAKDVAAAHEKDLAVQKKYGVNLINYWVDEKEGVVMCLAQAKDSSSLIKTHKEAHGLLPAYVSKVKQGE